MIGTWVSVLPPLIAIIMVFATKTGAVIARNRNSLRCFACSVVFGPAESLKNLWESVKATFWDGGLIQEIFILSYSFFY